MNLIDRLRALPSKPDPDQPLYQVVDRQTGCAWAMGAYFGSRQVAQTICMLLESKYGNHDLRVVRR